VSVKTGTFRLSSQVNARRTDSFTTENSAFCPYTVFMCSVPSLRKSIIFANTIGGLVFLIYFVGEKIGFKCYVLITGINYVH
jgi:hypothetical protein